MRSFVFTGLCLLLASQTLANPSASPLVEFDKAKTAYESGDYQAAVDIYEKALSEPEFRHNGHLYYNLASAYYRAGKTGEAAAALLAARRYLPRDADVKANLNFVQSFSQDKVMAGFSKNSWEKFWSWTSWLGPGEWWLLTSLMWGLSGFLLLLWIYKGLAPPCVLATILALFVTLGAYVQRSQGQDWGAVIAEEASIHSEPTDQSTALFRLHAGAPALILSESRNWLRIRVATPTESLYGWIKKDHMRSFL